MSDSEIKPRARRKRRRLLKVGLLMMLTGLCAGILFPNQTLNPLVRRFAPKAARLAGWNLQLRSLSGAPWKTWRLHGLQLHPMDAQSALQSLHFEELTVRVNSEFWWNPTAGHVQEIWGRTGNINLLIQETSSDTADVSTTPTGWDSIQWPRLDIADCNIEVQRPGIDKLEIEGLRLGLKASGQDSAPLSLTLKVGAAKHTQDSGATQEYAFDAVFKLMGPHLEIQECSLSQADKSQVQLTGQFDLSSLQRPLGEFDLRLVDWPLPDAGRVSARCEGLLDSEGLHLESLDAQSDRATSLRLEQVSIPWPGTGSDAFEAMLPKIEGQLITGGSDLGVWLKRFGGEKDPNGQDWPLGSYRLEASLSGGLVQIQQARVTLEHADWPAPILLSTQGSVPVDSLRAGEMQLSGLISVGQGKWSNGDGNEFEWPGITGGFAFEGAWPAGTGHFELHPSDVQLVPKDQEPVRMRWSGRCDLDQGNLNLRSLVGRFATLEQGTDMPGELKVRGILPTIEALGAAPSNASFNLQADLQLQRLGALRTLLPSLRRIEGSARGQVSLSGTLGAPKLRGSIEVNADSVRFHQGESFSKVTARVNWLDSSEGTFELHGQYGGAPVDIDGSLTLLNGEATWQASVQAQDFPLLRTPDARIRADGDLHIEGRGTQFDILGDVDLTHGRLQHDFDLAGSLLAAVEGRKKRTSTAPASEASSLEWAFPADCTLRVGLHTRKPVDLISDLGRSSLEIEGELIGRSGRLYPEGTIVLNGGRVSLPGSTLTWKQGVVLLPQGGGMPTIEALGTTRLSSHDVTLRIHGPLNDPKLELNSTPQRPDYDLLILLLTGELPQGRDWSRTTESLSLYLAKDVIKRWIGSDGGDGEGLFDRFEFSTGREVSESGLSTLEAMFRLQGDASGRGRATWITAERDHHEDVNFGLRFVLRPR